MMRFLLPLLLFFWTLCYADGSDFRVGAVGSNITILDYDKTEGSLVETVEVKRDKTTIFRFTDNAVGRYLVQSGLIKPKGKELHLVTVWSKGAHSEIMRVFNLEKKGNTASKEIERCNKASAWPMRLDVQADRIILHGTGSDIDPKTGIPKDQVFTCQL